MENHHFNGQIIKSTINSHFQLLCWSLPEGISGFEHLGTMLTNHIPSSCHDPLDLHLLPGGVGYHCSAEPKGGNGVSAAFACMDTWQPFNGFFSLVPFLVSWHRCGEWFAVIYLGRKLMCSPNGTSTGSGFPMFPKMWKGASRCCRPQYQEIHPP